MRYPLFLDLKDETVVVVGAGKVATRKVRALLKAGATVTVISPQAAAPLRQMAQRKKLRLVRRRYRQGDLRGARLVVAATNDEAVNKRVCAEAKRRKLLVNCVAPPSAGNFIVPSVVQRGRISIAISTGGASPALAKLLRRELADFLGDHYAEAADQMMEIRQTAGTTITTDKKRTALYRRTAKHLMKSLKSK